MSEPPSRDSTIRRIADCARAGERIGFALGAFVLIHAGTVRYLRRARERCDRLFAVALPVDEGASADADATLLKPSERVRVLSMLRETDAALLAGSDGEPALDDLRAAAPRAAWMRCEAEEDVGADIAARLETMGIELAHVGSTGECTTLEVLRRIAR
ncbi:hypothetical protein JW916_11080 [Candidatus Sumerlaeota bacterium]|nr:hypothetical protein [Candidatus Sumerlaeota bacterium]